MAVKELKKELTGYAEKLSEDELIQHAKSLLKKHMIIPYGENLSQSEISHLEEEFEGYQKKYPVE